MEGMERRGDGKRETERLERGRSRTEDKIDYRREPGTRTYVEGARAQSGDKTDRNTSTIHRAWGGFLFEHPPPRSSALLIRLNVATDLTRRTRDSLISVAIISVMQRRGSRNNISLRVRVFSIFFWISIFTRPLKCLEDYYSSFSMRSFLVFSQAHARYSIPRI